MGEELGVFLAHPKLQGLPAFLEVPGRTTATAPGRGLDVAALARAAARAGRKRKRRRSRAS